MLSVKELQKELSIKQNTFIFILLSFITGGFYYLYWTMRLAEKLSQDKGRAVVVLHLFILFAACQFFVLPIFSPFLDITYGTEKKIIGAIIGIANITNIALYVFVNLQLLPVLRECFASTNTQKPLSKVWALLFGSTYYYYRLYNAERLAAEKASTEQDEKINHLEKLAKLKGEGVITEEEFVEQKQKILAQ